MDLPLALAFTSGMLATVNPCGFAMLPAYLGYFLGLDDDDPDPFRVVVRALVVAGAVAAGFLVVFGVIGLLIAQFSLILVRYLPWVTAVLGVLLAVLGVAMLRGYEPSVRLPKLEKGTGSRAVPSMLVFGMSYAVASLSCTLPVFSATMTATLTRHSVLGVVVVLLCYGLGMGVILAGVTVALALARHSFVASLRRSMRYVHRAAGVLLVVAGLFLAYYGWYEHQVLNGGTGGGGASGPGRAALDLQGWISERISTIGATRLGAIVVIAITVVAFVYYALGDRRTGPTS